MRAIVTGAGGMLGRAVCAECARRGWQVVALARADCDVTDPEAVARVLFALAGGPEPLPPGGGGEGEGGIAPSAGFHPSSNVTDAPADRDARHTSSPSLQGRGNPELLPPAPLPQGEGGWVVINCAAYTQVDKAETERQAAWEANALAPGYLARAALQIGAGFLHISTDFVFDGHKSEPYLESDPTSPLGIYGETKRTGEEAVLAAHPQALVVRTSWLFGDEGKCFPRSILDALRAGKELRVVVDQTGCPTYCPDLARTLLELIERRAFPGTYHAPGPDAMTWHAFASSVTQEYAAQEGLEAPQIAPIRTEDWPTPARRPAYSVLGDTKLRTLGIPPMRPISEAIRDFVAAYRTVA